MGETAMPSRNRGKQKQRLRDLSRISPTKEEQDALLTAITSEAPANTTAILGAVFVEHELEVSLRRRFGRNDDDTWADMLADNGPLSSFYAKIVMGYAFRIYDESTMENLHIVRAIRNAFAHSKKLIDFEHQLIVAELKKTTVPTKGKRTRVFKDIQAVRDGAKVSYVALCFTLAIMFLEKRVRASEANSRRWKQTFAKRYPYAAGLASVLSPSIPKGWPGLGMLSSLVNRSADPKHVTLAQSALKSLRSDSTNDGSKGT